MLATRRWKHFFMFGLLWGSVCKIKARFWSIIWGTKRVWGPLERRPKHSLTSTNSKSIFEKSHWHLPSKHTYVLTFVLHTFLMGQPQTSRSRVSFFNHWTCAPTPRYLEGDFITQLIYDVPKNIFALKKLKRWSELLHYPRST